MDFGFSTSWTVLAIFVAAGLVKGVIGMGLPTLAMGLLGLVMPASTAAGLLVLPSLATNLWQALAGPGLGRVVWRLKGLLLGVATGTLASPLGLSSLPAGVAGMALGAALVIYAALALRGARWPVAPSREPWLGPLAGACTGVLTAATGVFVIPVVPYLQGLGLGKHDMVQALGLAFLTSTLALGLRLALDGAGAAAFDLPASTGPLLAAGLGVWLGQRLRGRLREAVFRSIFLRALLALGVWLLIQGLRA